QAKFYSDTLIKITQTTRIITGIGFESDETMSHYLIKDPQGVFPLNENTKSSGPVPAGQTLTVSPRVATATPPSATKNQPHTIVNPVAHIVK
ncbi:MAG: hypothetical protein Q8904_04805, partial [Bacteroidota bacterium]|nr:hypothetical protein [Bacteroidota bacterium]